MDLMDLLAAQYPSRNGVTPVEGVDVLPPMGRPQPAPPAQPARPAGQDLMTPFRPYTEETVPKIEQERSKRPSRLLNIMGIVGDAFLMRDGHDPIYGPAVEQRKMAKAMEGFDEDPMAAIGRVAKLPVPGAQEQAIKMYEAYQMAEYRRLQAESTAENRKSLEDNRRATQARQYLPYVSQILQDPRIKTKEDYAAAAERANTVLRNYVDPNSTIRDIGALDAEDWEPGYRFGLTQYQSLQDENTDLARQQQGQLGRERIGATMRGQDISAGNAAMRDETARRGQDMRPTGGGTTSARDRILGNNGRGGATPQPRLKPASPAAIEYLRKNPRFKKEFDAKYGAGAAKAYAGV